MSRSRAKSVLKLNVGSPWALPEMNQSLVTESDKMSANVALNDDATTVAVETRARPIMSAVAADAVRSGFRREFSRAMRALARIDVGRKRRSHVAAPRSTTPTGSRAISAVSRVKRPARPVSASTTPTAPTRKTKIAAITWGIRQPRMKDVSMQRRPSASNMRAKVIAPPKPTNSTPAANPGSVSRATNRITKRTAPPTVAAVPSSVSGTPTRSRRIASGHRPRAPTMSGAHVGLIEATPRKVVPAATPSRTRTVPVPRSRISDSNNMAIPNAAVE